MLFPKKDVKKLAPIKEVIKQAKLNTYGPKENWPDNLASPVSDGDDPKYADKDGYKDHWVIKASTNEDQKPGVIDENKRDIINPGDFYPGCYARAYLYAYTWEFAGKEGVSFILDHVQKIRDGKSFGGKKPAGAVFTPITADAESDDDDQDDDTQSF